MTAPTKVGQRYITYTREQVPIEVEVIRQEIVNGIPHWRCRRLDTGRLMRRLDYQLIAGHVAGTHEEESE